MKMATPSMDFRLRSASKGGPDVREQEPGVCVHTEHTCLFMFCFSGNSRQQQCIASGAEQVTTGRKLFNEKKRC